MIKELVQQQTVNSAVWFGPYADPGAGEGPKGVPNGFQSGLGHT